MSDTNLSHQSDYRDKLFSMFPNLIILDNKTKDKKNFIYNDDWREETTDEGKLEMISCDEISKFDYQRLIY